MVKRLMSVLMMAAVLSCGVAFAGGRADGRAGPSYVDGTYVGKAESHGGELTVTVTVRGRKIQSVDVKATDTAGIADAAIAGVSEAIIQNQSTDVDAVTGATVTSDAIIAAAKSALAEAIVYPVSRTVRLDVVVIGGGNAGLAAATEASAAGAKVVLLEKMSFLGGNTLRSGGAYNSVDPVRQSKQGIEDSIQKHYEQTLAGGDNAADPALVRIFAEGAPEGLKWLEGMGMKFDDKVFTVLGALWPRSHAPIAPTGTGFINTLRTAAEKNGVQILLNTTAVQLVKEKGRITAVVAADKNGVRTRYEAKMGVVLASGGFGANKELRQKYNPRVTPNLGTTNHPGATGDGLLLAEKIGAQLVGMEHIQLLPLGDPKTGALDGWVGFGVEDYIYINKEGKRFVSEAERRDVMTQALIRQTDQFMYIVCDAHSMPTPQTKNSFNQTAEQLVKAGSAFSADTIEELAVKIGVNPAAFRKTVDEYNAGVESKNDPFGKKLLGNKLNKPPFYASPRVPTVHHTMGGVKITVDTQVVGLDGKVIPGLYAAGEVTGGIHGTNRLGGNALPDTIVFGRIAGKNVVAMK